MLLIPLLVMMGILRVNGTIVSGLRGQDKLQCEPIKIEQCRSEYNTTGMPNMMGHSLQGDAKAGLETFLPLIQYGCSEELQFFLCSVHVPMCVELPGDMSQAPAHTLIGPCRPLCERVKAACLRILQEFNLEWPAALSCAKFPPSNDLENMCMEGGSSRARQAGGFIEGAKSFQTFNSLRDLIPKVKDFSKENPKLAIYDPIIRIIENSHNIKPAKVSDKCSDVAYPGYYHYVNITTPSLNRTKECVPQCGSDILYEKEDKTFAEIWIAVWASLCLLATTFSLLTFLLDPGVFLYPEKCIIFLNLSYFIMSFGYLLRLFLGTEAVSCMTTMSSANKTISLLVREGLAPSPECTTVFLLLYFSILSSAMWWAVMVTTWAVMVFSSLPQSSLTAKAPLFHSLGWGVPAALTLTCLVLHYVEGDELTGICLPGQQTEDTLLRFLVIPISVSLASAFIFFLSGLVASLVSPGASTRRLMARVSVFFVLYCLPQACVAGSLVYEVTERKRWRTEATARPKIEVFILRLFMWLIPGIISCAWVCSHKTLASWRGLFTRCCGLWAGAKKPPTPVFPKVAYHQAGAGDSGGSDLVTLGDLRPCYPGVGSSHGSGPLLGHERRTVIGSQETRIVL